MLALGSLIFWCPGLATVGVDVDYFGGDHDDRALTFSFANNNQRHAGQVAGRGHGITQVLPAALAAYDAA